MLAFYACLLDDDAVVVNCDLEFPWVLDVQGRLGLYRDAKSLLLGVCSWVCDCEFFGHFHLFYKDMGPAPLRGAAPMQSPS